MVMDALPDGVVVVYKENYMLKDTDMKGDVEEARQPTKAVVDAIRKYQPKDPDGADHKEIRNYLEALSAKATLAENAAELIGKAIDAR